jgi:virginiamycin A acetyltransferase
MSIELGEHSYKGSVTVQVWNNKSAVVKVGKFCSLANNIRFIIDGNHKMTGFSTFPFKEVKGWDCPVNVWGKDHPIVGNDVWIGQDVVIYSGVKIGNGAVIAGQSVVTKDVPAYSLVAGNPARVKKYRFSEEIIKDLEELKWWDLPLDTIKTRLIPYAEDMEKFIEELRKIKA